MVRFSKREKLPDIKDCSAAVFKKTTVKFTGPKSGEDFFESFEEINLFHAVITYICFIILNLLGRLQDFMRRNNLLADCKIKENSKNKGFVPLYSDYESFYTRNIYRRVRDCWNRPICSAPGIEIELLNRVTNDYGWTFNFTGDTSKVLNFGSYNYLGFGCPVGPWIEETADSIRKYGLSTSTTYTESGGLHMHRQLEKAVAEFVGQEDCIITAMGFATNSLNMPCIFDKDSCILSDELNHNSMILGCRLSGARIVRFKHNDMEDLEKKLIDVVVYGHPRTRRPYRKIFLVVEGIYSMEGSIVHLPELIALKKKYKAYLYLDEAHSIGAMGERGRGVVDYFGCDPADVDLAMGTFTKSFGAAGGYIAGKRQLIDHLRANSFAANDGILMPVPICQQIISTIDVITGKRLPGEGQYRLDQLAWNTRYFRARCHQMGLVVYGNRDSPVVPIIIYMPGKLIAFSRKCLANGIGTVVVGFPATALLLSRARFCISANHSKEVLDRALAVIQEATTEMNLNYSRMKLPSWCEEAIKTPPPSREQYRAWSKLDQSDPANFFHLSRNIKEHYQMEPNKDDSLFDLTM